MRLCSVDDCKTKHVAKGFCMKHYRQMQRVGTEKPSVQIHKEHIAANSTLPCKTCLQEKVSNQFAYSRYHLNATKTSCNDCVNLAARLRRYSLSEKEMTLLLLRSGGICEICRDPATEGLLHVDHDHSCCNYPRGATIQSCGNCVRALLCRRCNLLVGAIENNIDLVEDVQKYLQDGVDGRHRV